jgi:hypothetical protein
VEVFPLSYNFDKNLTCVENGAIRTGSCSIAGVPLSKEKMITLNEFNKLSLSSKSKLVWEWGNYLTNCKYGNYKIVIFAFSDFYVELCQNISENTAERVKAVEFKELHHDYIKAINSSKAFSKPALSTKHELLMFEAA